MMMEYKNLPHRWKIGDHVFCSCGREMVKLTEQSYVCTNHTSEEKGCEGKFRTIERNTEKD